MTFALGTFSTAGCPPFSGLVVGGRVVSLHAVSRFLAASGRALSGTHSMLSLLESWDHDRPLIEELAEALAHARTPELDACAVAVEALSVHAPIPAPRHIYCTDMNYGKRVFQPISRQAGDDAMTMSAEGPGCNGTPHFFLKAQSSVTGPYDPIILPVEAKQPDWNLQLAAVIGRVTHYVSRERALDHIAGYTIANDITRRELLSRRVDDGREQGMNWALAKSSPTFLPLGPYLLPSACVDDPQSLHIRVTLNEKVIQEESTSDMIFSVARLIEYLSTVVVLQPGDLVLTGSPIRDGAHHRRFLRPGDVLEGTISALGMQRNRCIEERR